MKLSYVVATPEVTAGSDLTAYHGPLEPFFGRLRELGYDGVELMVLEPREVDVATLKQTLRNTGLGVAVVNTGRLWMDDRICLMHPPGSERNAALDSFRRVIDFAVAVSIDPPEPFGVQINSGLSRGVIGPGQDPVEARDWVVENLRTVADYARERGVTIALEPINRFQTNFINSGQEGIDFIREVGSGNLRLQMDVFHMNMEEPSICGSLIRYHDWMSHLHICDTNRGVPGSGHLDFVEIIDTLKALAYPGFLSAEMQTPDHTRGAELLVDRIGPLL